MSDESTFAPREPERPSTDAVLAAAAAVAAPSLKKRIILDSATLHVPGADYAPVVRDMVGNTIGGCYHVWHVYPGNVVELDAGDADRILASQSGRELAPGEEYEPPPGTLPPTEHRP